MHFRTFHALLAAIPLAAAQQILDQLSFGHQSTISPNGRAIPGWHVQGSQHNIELLSDRVVLTPPTPGATRGSLWAETTISSTEWTADFEFRASGEDSGSGNIQLWFAKDKSQIGDGSVYTVGSFDGLALVIDQYGGKGGSIRGFLNDGSQNYQAHSSLESLAFGHCDYSYRNLGRPSKLKVEHRNGLTVSIDDRVCFRSDKIALPSDYYFGITAAKPETPESFEVFKFVVSTPETETAKERRKPPASPPRQQQQQQDQSKRPSLERLGSWPSSEVPPDAAPETIRSQEEQFADLHNRLQGLTHQIANIFGEFDRLARTLDERHTQLLQSMPAVPVDEIQSIARRLEGVERDVKTVQREVEGRDYKQHFTELKSAVEGVRGGLTEHLPDTIGRLVTASAPRMGFFVFIIVGVQVALAAAFVLYKRRRANAPKKYL